MKPDRILLLEDDANLGAVLAEHLQLNGYEVTLCTDGVQGLKAYADKPYDLCLVDIMMPKKDGFAFATEIRKQDEKIPLIFLTARSMKEDRIQGFKIGCDDYITKPFSVEELLLRMQAVLKRCKGGPTGEPPAVFILGGYRFDYTRQLLVYKETQTKLTSKESDLLRLLCLHMNQTLTRELALREVWDNESYFSGRSMDVFISRLRKYLKDDPTVQILGIHGKGFRLVVS